MGWTRAELKERAKAVLKESYWKAFVVALILGLVCGGGGGGGNYNFGGSDSGSGITSGGCYGDGASFIDPAIIAAMVGVIGIIIVIALAFAIFVAGPLEVGCQRYYVRAAQKEVNMGYIVYSFEGGRYMAIVKTMFFRNLYLFFWTLLFIIPGIIKSYSYRMVPYILADNPNMDTERAITLSMEMMDGEKFDTFVLDLSFIGWYILGTLALLVGVLFVNPYYFSTNAELYLVLREKALREGICTYEELNIKREMSENATQVDSVLTIE